MHFNCIRYREFPSDVKVEDVSKCQRVLTHVNASLNEMKNVSEKLISRKRELYDAEVKPKPWASSEIFFVDTFLAMMEEITKGTEKIALDVQHVMHQLEKRFDKSAIDSSERKRKARRNNEQKYKTKRKKQILSER